MLKSLLRLNDFYWHDDTFRPVLEMADRSDRTAALQNLQGQFSIAHAIPGKRVLLARDRLGIHKLFFAVHETGHVLVANYLYDLVEKGVPWAAIFSVPAGHVLQIDLQQQRLTSQRYFSPVIRPSTDRPSLADIAATIRQQLERWFARLAKSFSDRKICLCVSGGLDSSLIATFATRYFTDVTAYTYGYVQAGQAQSDDVHYGQKLADFLGIPFRFVPATDQDVFRALDNALRYGQDWRDFNVHCAIVNDLVGRAIAHDRQSWESSQCPLLLTGDLMNEFLADYTPVAYAGRDYYTLPKLDIGVLRTVLMRGLDAGDREVGVFNRHGLEVIQPYGLLVEQFLRVPNDLLGEQRSKQALFKAIATDLLPPFILNRTKVRAQIGNSDRPTGILPLLVDAGYDANSLRKRFCQLFRIDDNAFLDRFIQMGRYRLTNRFPDGPPMPSGYLTR